MLQSDITFYTVSNLKIAGIQDIYAINIDDNGQVIWAKSWGAYGAIAKGNAIAVFWAGRVFIAGSISGENNSRPTIGKTDAILIQVHYSNGDLMSFKNYGGLGAIAEFTSVDVDNGGTAYAVGNFTDADLTTPPLIKIGIKDAFVVGQDLSGLLKFSNNYGGAGASIRANDIVWGFDSGSSYSYFVVGEFSGGNMTKPYLEKKGVSDAFIFGGFGYGDSIRWANNYGAQGSNARFNSIEISQTSGISGFFLAGGDFTNKISEPKLEALGTQDGFLLKLNPDGQTLWSTNYGGKSAITNINDVASSSPAKVSGSYSGSSLTRPNLTLNGLKDGFLILEDIPYTLSVNKYPDNSGDGGVILSQPSGIQCGVVCSSPFSSGATITLTATPKSGYKFSYWMGDCSGTEACTLTMTSDKFVTAAFQSAPELTVTKTGDGTINSTPAGIACGTTCSATYTQGISVTLTAVASPGYKFTNWTGACSGNEECTVTMDNAKTVGAVFTAIQIFRTLTVSKAGEGTITSLPASISCGSICSSSFLSASTVSLIAQPDFGFVFSGWSGACSSTGTCALMMDGDKSVSANFTELPKYQVKITKPSTGVISSEPAGILCGGLNKQCISSFSSAKLTAIPNPGYEFIRWNGCQAPEGINCYIKPAGKMTVSAAFKKLPKYNIKITKNTLGSIVSTPAGLKCPEKKKSCSVKFVKGTEVTVIPVPQAGRTFGGWTGACSGLDPCTFLMDGNKGVEAMFQ